MTASRDPDRLIHHFLLEGEEQLQDQVYDAVRAEIEHKSQRVVIGPWRTPVMSKIVGFGLAAAAVVVAAFIGAQLLGSPNVGGPDVESTPTATHEATPTPSPSAEAEYPRSVVVTNTDAPVMTTVEVGAPGWIPLPGLDAITKDDDGLDPPEAVGAAFLAWAWPAGTGFHVYEDPCRWSSTIPETPATTSDEIATALAAQAMTDATEPVDVTVGGYAGKAITLTVPMSFDLPDATREEKFGDCDQDLYGFYGIEGEAEPARNAQGAGQIDELWIIDVDGAIVILDAAYSPATPPEMVEEMRAMVESATFEAP